MFSTESPPWLPVNRSYALEPVMSASLCAPPTASSSLRHSALVDESIQTGESSTEKACASSSCRNLSAIQTEIRFKI